MLNIKKLNKALICIKNKDFETAEKIYYELLRENPNDDTVLSFWGVFNLKKGLYTKAEKVLESAYKIKKTPSTISALALTKFKLKKYDDSIILYEELFRYDKDSEKIYQKIIECFRRLKMYDFAGAYCKKYLLSHPNSCHALSLMTEYLIDINDYKKAEEYCVKTIELYPNTPSIWAFAGFIQEFLYCNEEYAQECYKKAIELGDTQSYYHLGVSYQKINRLDDAELCYSKAIELYPNDYDAKSALGSLYFAKKQFKKGYQYYMERVILPENISCKNFNTEMTGGILFVVSDQGLGDAIMFSRYLPLLKPKFSKIVVQVREPLLTLFRNSFEGIDFITHHLSENEYDCSMCFSYLPYFLDLDFSKIPYIEGYLKVNESDILEYKQKYFDTNKIKVGLCWKAGDLARRSAIHRTINIDYFKPLLELNNVEFYSFQKGDIFNAKEKYPQIVDLSDTFNSFSDTAAAMKNLDLMISVDTSNIHLAGALGVKSKLLIPYCSDWRWFDNKEKTEWYDSVEIIKQEDRQDWYKEINVLTDYVKKF